MNEEITPKQKAVITLMAAIDAGLKILDYKHIQFTGFKEQDTGDLVMLARSPDEIYLFSIKVNTVDCKPIDFSKIKKAFTQEDDPK